MSTWNDIIADALIEINAYGPTDSIDPAEVQLAIRKLSRLIDQWAARKIFAFATTFTEYTLTPNHSPHLIGPGVTTPPDFVCLTPARPARIRSAALVLNDQTPGVDLTLRIRDRAWWANQRVKGLSSDVPTDLYYETDFPNGALYFWPIPAYAYGVRLETETALTSVPLNTAGEADPTQTFSAPEGYENAAYLTLAEHLCDAYGRPMPASLPQRAKEARIALQSNNAKSRRTGSADYGVSSRRRGGFNYYSGGPA
jgi:hypothetical protein